MPDPACGGPSDIAPIWNPEFFGNTIVVNGATWPSLEVQQRRYRFRFLNGCNSRFLILRMDNGLPFWQIGNEGGFLPAPVELTQLLLGPAERADVIVDFTERPRRQRDHPARTSAPTSRSAAASPGVDFEPADPETTGQVMRFHVVAAHGARSQHAAEPARAAGDRAARRRAPTRARSRSTSRSPRRCA